MKDLQTLKSILYKMAFIFTKRQKVQCIWIFVLIIIGSMLEMLGVSSILPFIEAITSPEKMAESWYGKWLNSLFNVSYNRNLILIMGLFIILIYVIKNIVLFYSYSAQARFRLQLQKDLSSMMMNSYLSRPYSFFLKVNSGEIIQSIDADIMGVYGILEFGFRFLSEGLTVSFIALYLLYVDVLMAIGVFGVAAICGLGILFFTRKKIKIAGERNRSAAAKQKQSLLQIITGIKEIMVMQKNAFFAKQYEEIYEEKKNADTLYNTIILLPDRLIEGICISGIMAIVCVKVALGADLANLVSILAAFAVAAFRVLPSVSKISNSLTGIIFYRPMLDVTYDNIKRTRAYMQEFEMAKKEDSCRSNNTEKIKFEENVVIDGLCWRYEGAEQDVLHNLSIKINKGEMIGIVGESGAGKSTFADIILGLLKPDIGEIKVDNKKIKGNDASWNSMLGYVPQNVFLIDDSIRRNVAFGIEDEEIDDEQVWRALERAQLADFVREMPDGLDSLVGDRGIRISGGQRQRMVIARMIYRDPEIIILDEATSALDNSTENAVMEAINALHGEKTIIIIAHRLTTIEKCDRVYRIKDGIAEEVKHSDW